MKQTDFKVLFPYSAEDLKCIGSVAEERLVVDMLDSCDTCQVHPALLSSWISLLQNTQTKLAYFASILVKGHIRDDQCPKAERSRGTPVWLIIHVDGRDKRSRILIFYTLSR